MYLSICLYIYIYQSHLRMIFLTMIPLSGEVRKMYPDCSSTLWL